VGQKFSKKWVKIHQKQHTESASTKPLCIVSLYAPTVFWNQLKQKPFQNLLFKDYFKFRGIWLQIEE